ncbi:MAG: hypothetical protein ACXVCP_06680 [Bdellovibrio sp.]
MPKIICFTGFLFFSLTAESQTSLRIQVSQIVDGMAAEPIIGFSEDKDSCTLEFLNKKKSVKIPKNICQKDIKVLQSDLEEPFGPSDYVNPKQKYYEVQVISGTKTWRRIVQQEYPTLCTADNKCTPPKEPAPWRIVKALYKYRTDYLEKKPIK